MAVEGSGDRRNGIGLGGGFVAAYSDDGDRRFRFIVTGLERGEVLGVDDNSVGHDGIGIGTVFRRLTGPSERLALEG